MKSEKLQVLPLLITSLTCLAISGVATSSLAAKPKTLNVAEALRLPMPDRIEHLQKNGVIARAELEKMAFDKKESLENRWRAVTAVGRMYPRHTQGFLEKAMNSPEWFMRNAALVVVPYAEHGWGVKWSRKMLGDSSLVVRTAAVQSLRQMGAREAGETLWEKLYSSENYHGGESLWIRRHILETLSEFAHHGQEKDFIRVLSDADKSLHSIAIKALEKITSERFEDVASWKSWWSHRSI